MAIKKTLNLDNGLTVNDAICDVKNIQMIGKDILIDYAIYANEAIYNDDGEAIKQERISIPAKIKNENGEVDNPNYLEFITLKDKAFSYLKSLPEFEDAVDC